jgi:regulatory protein
MARRRRNDGEPPDAKERALALLARREQSASELGRKLVRGGVQGEEATATVAKLRDTGLQSDERFAGSLIRRRASAGYGPRYIEAELRTHRIDPRRLGELLAEPDWREIAGRIIERRFPAGIADREVRQKAAQFLTRRGFPPEVIHATCRVRVPDEA